MIVTPILRQVSSAGASARKIAGRLLAISVLTLSPLFAAHAAVSVNIGIHVSAYPNLVLVPGYPVYYDPDFDSNYFFYDGEYWVYDGDNWYSSDWYDGPWDIVEPYYVPLFLLRVPVRYYHRPPVYFRGWAIDAPPRWGEHWGRTWEDRRRGWDRWDRASVPHAAPLPTYQRQYSGNRYPRAPEQQRSIRTEQYRYQPHDAITRQHFQEHATPQRERNETAQRPPQQQRSDREAMQQRSVQERADRARPQPNQVRQPPQPTPQTNPPTNPQANLGRPARNEERRVERAPNQEQRRQPQAPQPAAQPQPNRERPAPRVQRPEPRPQEQQQQHEGNRGPQERPPNSGAPQNREQPKQDEGRGRERDRQNDDHH